MTPAVSDPGSLSHLHDIVVVPSVSWWPPAPAWYVAGAILLIAIGGSLCCVLVRRRRNWYRRAGLAELSLLESQSSSQTVGSAELATLLKRVALAGYPRQDVASLTGTDWLAFLDRTGRTREFTAGAGRAIADIYGPHSPLPPPELFRVVRHWIRHHRSSP